MEVLEAGTETKHVFDLEVTEEERVILLRQAYMQISSEELNRLVLEWYLPRVIEEAVNRVLKK